MAVNDPYQPTPAQATSRSTCPAAASAAWPSSPAPATDDRSAGSGTEPVRAATWSRRATSRPDTSSRQPSAARQSATDAPIPEDAPVTRATPPGLAPRCLAGAAAAGVRELAPAVMMPMLKASPSSAWHQPQGRPGDTESPEPG